MEATTDTLINRRCYFHSTFQSNVLSRSGGWNTTGREEASDVSRRSIRCQLVADSVPQFHFSPLCSGRQTETFTSVKLLNLRELRPSRNAELGSSEYILQKCKVTISHIK